MSGDGSSEGLEGTDADPAERTDEFLSELAARTDRSEAEVEERLLAALENAEDGDRERRLAAVESAVEELQSDLDAKIQDVRERVVQVKREADAKAPEDHDHPELDEKLERIVSEFGDLRGTVEDLEGLTERGFDNYEAVLDYLAEATEDIENKLDVVGRAVVDLRERTDALAETRAREAAVARLSETANLHGVREADCESCGRAVDIALLEEPRCPHCEEQFSELEPRQGLFSADVLHTGTPPALTPAEDAEAAGDDVADIFDEGEEEDPETPAGDDLAEDAEDVGLFGEPEPTSEGDLFADDEPDGATDAEDGPDDPLMEAGSDLFGEPEAADEPDGGDAPEDGAGDSASREGSEDRDGEEDPGGSNASGEAGRDGEFVRGGSDEDDDADDDGDDFEVRDLFEEK